VTGSQLLQHAATHCNTLHHSTHESHKSLGDRDWKPPAARHCNTLQHTATHCNTLQHSTHESHISSHDRYVTRVIHVTVVMRLATHYNTLPHAATHCNTLQHSTHEATCHQLYFFMSRSSCDSYFCLLYDIAFVFPFLCECVNDPPKDG